MLPVLIYEPDHATRIHLCESVNDYIHSHETLLRIQENTESLDEAVRCADQEQGISLMLLGLASDDSALRNKVVRLGEKAFQKNRDSYMIYCLHNAHDLEVLLTAGVRTAGILLYPLDQAKMDKLLRRIDRDFAEIRERETGKCLIVDSGNTTYRIPYSRIIYIEALDQKLNIWTERQSISVRMTLNYLEDALPTDLFFRSHRSFFINMRYVDSVDFSGMEIHLTGGIALPLSRSYKDKMKSLLEQERNAPFEN